VSLAVALQQRLVLADVPQKLRRKDSPAAGAPRGATRRDTTLTLVGDDLQQDRRR
jgi:hypothetical protein